MATRGGTQTPGIGELKFTLAQRQQNLPTHLDPTRCSHRLVSLSEEKLSAEYIGIGRHNNDVGAVQGNRPVPLKRLLYYFEITVADRGRRGRISIGFTGENFKLTRHPGWEHGSWGYHGDDGYFFHRRGRADPFGPTFTTGDTVGAGISYATSEIFFTKNGQLLGRTEIEGVEGALFPTIGMHSGGEKVEVNFGQREFVFDMLVQEEWERRRRAVESVPLPL